MPMWAIIVVVAGAIIAFNNWQAKKAMQDQGDRHEIAEKIDRH